jgi:RNA polymerase sigma-70 factor (ECF subfamily)
MNGSQPEDERRFDEAFHRDWPAVYRFAVAWTNDLSSAEDIAQEAFTRLWDRRKSMDWERPVVPWLLVVTRRLATDRFRRLKTPFVGPGVRDLNEDGVAAWLDIRAAFRRLSPNERAALVSITILGFKPEEAAEALGMSPGAVRAAVSRAREKLESER